MLLLNSAKRGGFSLLEMVIALALAMVLLLALYITLSTQISFQQSGREVMNDGAVARSVMSRINADVCNQVGPVDPRMQEAASAAAGAASSAASSDGITTPDSTTTTLTAVSYNIGVRGDATSLVLSLYRVRRPPAGQPTDQPDPVVISDLTRINYWLVMNGTDAAGLARQEIQQATSPDIDLGIPDISNPNQFIIAEEVKNVLFEYFDGSSWQQSWDGTDTSTSPDGATPKGPPAAIRITLTLRRNTRKTETVTDNPDDATNTYQHVIALPTSNNPAPKTSTSP